MKHNVEIYFPIVPDFQFEFEEYPFEQKEIIITEIHNVLKDIDFNTSEYIISSNITIRILEDESDLIIQNLDKPFLHGTKEDALNFSIDVSVDLDKLVVTKHLGKTVERITDPKELAFYLPYTLSGEFGNKIFEILMLSQIARPGSLKLREGIVLVDNKRQREIIPEIIKLREAFDYSVKKGYPKIDFIDLRKYYSWLQLNNLIFSIPAKNSYQKAINIFSYLNGDSERIIKIIYQMMILEQLYTDSNTQISEQLNIKIQIYLGEIESYKQQIKNMYNIRSRFLHGDLSILPSHLEYTPEEYPKFETELNDAENLSVLIIIATLQKMFKDNLFDLRFVYNLSA